MAAEMYQNQHQRAEHRSNVTIQARGLLMRRWEAEGGPTRLLLTLRHVPIDRVSFSRRSGGGGRLCDRIPA